MVLSAPYSLPGHIFPGACLPTLCFQFPSPGKTQALKKGGHEEQNFCTWERESLTLPTCLEISAALGVQLGG